MPDIVQFGVIEEEPDIPYAGVCNADGICSGEEDYQNCPQDCLPPEAVAGPPSELPAGGLAELADYTYIIIAAVVIVAAAAVIIVLWRRRKPAWPPKPPEEKPKEKPEEKPPEPPSGPEEYPPL
jgi:hypothetical protein